MRNALISALALLCACSMYRVDNGRLSDVSVAEREKVRYARGAYQRAVDVAASRTLERSSAEDRVEIADAEFAVAEAELGTARIKSRLADQDGSRLEREATQAAVAHCEASLEAARLGIALRECDLHVAIRREDLAQKTAKLRDAEVELCKARAVHNVDSAANRSVVLTRFELQVKERERSVATAELREAEASERRIAAHREFEAAQMEATRLGYVTATGDLMK